MCREIGQPEHSLHLPQPPWYRVEVEAPKPARLTRMATIATLVGRGTLEEVSVEFGQSELRHRLFFARPRFTRWLGHELLDEPRDRHGSLSPAEQTYELLRTFMTGGRLVYGAEFHELHPLDYDVWELKTVDVRMFGWFVKKDVFIAVNGAMAKLVKDRKMYSGFRDEVKMFRARLDLDEPKFIPGAKADEVVSF